MLENQLNKAELKHNEAVTIQRTYHQIKAHLMQVNNTNNLFLEALYLRKKLFHNKFHTKK